MTTEHLRKIEHNPYSVSPHLKAQIRALAKQYRFFHWHLEFPAVFGADGEGGFDCVLGNPPWEKINLKDEEFFAETHPHIAKATNKAARKRLIEKLKIEDLTAYTRYETAQEMHDRTSAFFRFSGNYPLTGVSRINLYSIFAELSLRLICPDGRCGLVLASGIVTDDNNKDLFSFVVTNQQLINVWDFENRQGIFTDVDSRFRFCLFCAGGSNTQEPKADFAFYLTSTDQISEEERHFNLTAEDLFLLNPNTRTCPTFRSSKEAEITKTIYRKIPAWIRHDKSPTWPGTPKTPFNMSNDSALFVEQSEVEVLGGDTQNLLPLYESKFIHQFSHRYATFSTVSSEGAQDLSELHLHDPMKSVNSRYWMSRQILEQRFPGRWFLVYRKITQATNERTSIAAIIPKRPCGDSLIIVGDLSAVNAGLLCAILNSFVYDYCARQKVAGTNFNHWIWHQLPIPLYEDFIETCPFLGGGQTLLDWISPRVLELTYTAWDLELFAKDCCFEGPPFDWNEDRRFQLRCELDAAFFNLYGVARNDVEYIMGTFSIIKRKDEAKYGNYRTKDTILALYDALADAQSTGQAFVSTLHPPPADLGCCHPPKESDINSPPQISYALLPDGAWLRPLVDQSAEIGALLAAVLKTVSGPTPSRYIRLIALLASEARLLTPALSGEEGSIWKRLIGPEAEPHAKGVTSLVPRADRAWGSAVQHLRSSGLLVEDLSAGTWAPGVGLESFYTEGWPEGRVQMVLSILSKRGTEEIVRQLPNEIQRWLDAKAA